MERDANEDLIEATIRRVAASKAARLDPEETEDDEEEHPAPALRLVPPNETAPDEDRAPSGPRPRVEESVIEATLRRIEAEQATRGDESASAGEDLGDEDVPAMRSVDVAASVAGSGRPAVDESLIEATLRRIEAQQAATVDDGGATTPAPWATSIEPSREARSGDVQAEFESWEDAARELHRELAETKTALRSLAARVDAIAGSAPPTEPRTEPHPAARPAMLPPAQVPAADDDWDDTPQLPRIPLGTAPPRAILLDRPPASGTSPGDDVTNEPQLSPAPHAVEETAAPAAPAAKHGFDLLPRTYRITVEDKRRGVDLVPLHRALLGMDGVREMSLLSYSNGTAIVALETTTEILPDALGSAVSHAMAREVKVEVHNEQTMVIKLAED